MKQKGIIRRLQATPLKAGDIMFAQVVTRIIVALIVTLILIAVGVFLFDVNFKGNILLGLLISVMGAGVFLSMGFAIAGIAKTEESASPIANIVTLSQMFLSGIFFSRDVIPGVVKHITDYLPLTFLADSLRNVAIQGQGVSDVWPQLLGLAV
ncbi:MAG: ABC transporter permease [Dehalococcoidia bacterium]|nr:ABC transporter permease [Dehalococcoidia bacterium]